MGGDCEISGCMLGGGRQATATVSDAAVVITVSGPGAASESVQFEHPRHGLAGGRLVPSASGRFLIVSHFSGQSEESYCLYDTAGGLHAHGVSESILGETAGFAFSPDERLLVAAIPATCCEWRETMEEELDTLPFDTSGRRYFEFGVVLTHDLVKGSRHLSTLRVLSDDAWSTHGGAYDPELKPSFASQKEIRLSMPWGPVDLPFPLTDAVAFHPPVPD